VIIPPHTVPQSRGAFFVRFAHTNPPANIAGRSAERERGESKESGSGLAWATAVIPVINMSPVKIVASIPKSALFRTREDRESSFSACVLIAGMVLCLGITPVGLF
jgi:hypothetical protein